MEKPIVRRKPINPALIEKTCNKNNNNNFSNKTNLTSSCTSSTSSILNSISPTSFDANSSPKTLTSSNLGSTSPKNLDSTLPSSSTSTSTSSSPFLPSSKDGVTSPHSLHSSSNVISPILKAPVLRSSTMETSSRPSSTYSDTSSSSNSTPSLKKENTKSASSTKQKAKKWFQETKAFIEGFTHSNDPHNEDEDKYIYFKPNCNFLDEPPSFPLEPLKLYEYTPPPWRIFQDHTDLQMMCKVLKLNRDRLSDEAINQFRRANDLQTQVDRLTLALQQEKEHHAQTIRVYEARIKAWMDRYDLLFNKWAKKEKLDSLFYYNDNDLIDPVARAALKCHAFETEIQKLLQRLVHAVKKAPLTQTHPIQNPSLPKLITPPSTSNVLPSSFLNAIMQPKDLKDALLEEPSSKTTLVTNDLVTKALQTKETLETMVEDQTAEVSPSSLTNTELEPTPLSLNPLSSSNSPPSSTLLVPSSPLKSSSELIETSSDSPLPTSILPPSNSSPSTSSPPSVTPHSLSLTQFQTTLPTMSETVSSTSSIDSTSHFNSILVTDSQKASSFENLNDSIKQSSPKKEETTKDSSLLSKPIKDLTTDVGFSFDTDILDLIDSF